MHIYLSIYTYTYAHTHRQTHTDTHRHTDTQTHTHTHIQPHEEVGHAGPTGALICVGVVLAEGRRVSKHGKPPV